MTVEYKWLPGSFAIADLKLLEECSALYSNHYGVWSSSTDQSRAGQHVQLTSDRIREWLKGGNSRIAIARLDGQLIGYAIAIQDKLNDGGLISWVTQLVVHEGYRKQGIGKTLLFSIWQLSDRFAWGVVTSSPYAIRALEKATRRRCDPKRIIKNWKKMANFGVKNVLYIKKNTEFKVTHDTSKCNTDFFVSHHDVAKQIERVTSPSTPWLLGKLDEGWEWFAFTFQDQLQLDLTQEEIEAMLEASDQITKEAYSRMHLNENHLWAQHTDKEVELIIDFCTLRPGNTILDLGCGEGRHAIALSKHGINVTAVDYVEKRCAAAQDKARSELRDNTPQILCRDCRNLDLQSTFDAVICLYDVIGTYVTDEDNLDLLRTIARHLSTGGKTLISVMNYDLTKDIAINTFSMRTEPNRILSIQASQTMESSGNIFNPELYLLDDESKIVYRKEQFVQGATLPCELIVRDRRFSIDEITSMCESVGLKVLWHRFICAGQWENALHSTHKSAKEILLLCEKQEF